MLRKISRMKTSEKAVDRCLRDSRLLVRRERGEGGRGKGEEGRGKGWREGEEEWST